MPLADGWRERSGRPSLSEVFRSVAVPVGVTPFRRFLAFVGPGYLVAVGYMDPGNWATSLAGGAAFGYQLLFIALLSNTMAILLQSSTRYLRFVATIQKCHRASPCRQPGRAETSAIAALTGCLKTEWTCPGSVPVF